MNNFQKIKGFKNKNEDFTGLLRKIKNFSIVPKFVDGTDSCGLSGQNREKNRLGKGRN